MTTEKTDTSAPAAQASEQAVTPPDPRPNVDLSDLQAELDANKRQADEDEIFDDIKAGTKKKGDDEPDSDEDEGEADADKEDADPADEDEDGKDDEDAEGEDEPDEAQKKGKPRHKRYREQIARLEQENAQLRSRAGGSLSQAQINEHVESIIGPEPDEKAFDNYLDYDRERTAWLLDKRQVMRETVRGIKAAQEERAGRVRENVDAHTERVEEFRNRNGEESAKDFDAVMSKAKDLRVAPAVEELILESPNSAHLQYFFARNPQRLDKINRMSEREAAREVGHIEARLSLPQPRTKSAAPKPTRAPKGGVAPASQEADLTSWLNKKYGSR